jgi:hypothetical protein
LGFIGCEGVDVDAEDFDDFIGEPFFQYLLIWAERFVSTSIGYLCDLHKIFVSA